MRSSDKPPFRKGILSQTQRLILDWFWKTDANKSSNSRQNSASPVLQKGHLPQYIPLSRSIHATTASKKKKRRKKNIPPREKETIAAPKSISSCHSRSLKTTTIDERSSPRGGGGGELLKRLEGKKKRNQKERWRKRGRKMERKR